MQREALGVGSLILLDGALPLLGRSVAKAFSQLQPLLDQLLLRDAVFVDDGD